MKIVLLTASSTILQMGLLISSSYKHSTHGSSQRTSNVLNIDHILQSHTKCFINCDSRNNSDLKLIKVLLNGFSILEMLALCFFPDRSTDSISCLQRSDKNLESYVASCAGDLNYFVGKGNTWLKAAERPLEVFVPKPTPLPFWRLLNRSRKTCC